MTEHDPDLGKHPRGTLAIMSIFGILFVVGWLLVFFLVYLPRGAITR
jgi:hypothetical protein